MQHPITLQEVVRLQRAEGFRRSAASHGAEQAADIVVPPGPFHVRSRLRGWVGWIWTHRRVPVSGSPSA